MVRVGRLTGIQVRAHWSVLVTVALFGTVLAVGVIPVAAAGIPLAVRGVAVAITAVLFSASVLAHGMVQAIAARRLGVEVDSVDLWLLGATARFRGPEVTPATEAEIALVGPVASLVLAIASVSIGFVMEPAGSSLIVDCMIWLALGNALVAAVNLLPASSLDGGRVLHALVWRQSGERRHADRWVGRVAGAVAVAFVAIGLFETFVGAIIAGLCLTVAGGFIFLEKRAEAGRLLRNAGPIHHAAPVGL